MAVEDDPMSKVVYMRSRERGTTLAGRPVLPEGVPPAPPVPAPMQPGIQPEAMPQGKGQLRALEFGPDYSQDDGASQAQRPIEEKALAMLPSAWLFEEEPLPDPNRKIEVGETLVLDTRVNAALRLAHRNHFMTIVAPCLWGDEQDVELVRLGYLARGAVMTFTPVNVFELYLVGNIVSAQWKLDRTLRIQKAVFEAYAQKKQSGKHGLPTGTWAAMELDEEVMKAQKMLESAIKSYQMATKRDKLSSKAW